VIEPGVGHSSSVGDEAEVGSMKLASIFDTLTRRAIEHPRAIAIQETSGRRITYAELTAGLEAVAAGLAGVGMRPGERVLFAVRPGIDAFLLILGIVRAGGVVVALDPGTPPDVFAARMALVCPRWVAAEGWIYALGAFTPARLVLRRLGVALPALGRLRGCRFIHTGRRWPGTPPSLALDRLLESAATPRAAPPAGDDPVFVVFTSGTTDAPKAVVHSADSIAATVRMAGEHLAAASGDVVYTSQLHLVLPALLGGARVIVPRSLRFSPARLLRDLHRYRVTHTFGLPAEFRAVADLCHRRGTRMPRSLRMILLGSAPVYRPFLERLPPVVPSGTAVWCVYAMTEMLPACLVSMEEKLSYVGEGDLVGMPFPGVRVCVAEDGELVVAGPNLFHGYLGGPPVQEHPTGDLARIDEQGRVVLLGRGKDMIIRGHHNIYPALVEPSVEAVAGVRRCALVGLYRHGAADETVVLAVEPEAAVDARALRRRLMRELRHGPHRIDPTAWPDRIVFMPLPLTGRSRKVNKAALRRALGERPSCE
jgi:acyl-CoA synthetase (AMP-forming)/AMP-acid ligase II